MLTLLRWRMTFWSSATVTRTARRGRNLLQANKLCFLSTREGHLFPEATRKDLDLARN